VSDPRGWALNIRDVRHSGDDSDRFRQAQPWGISPMSTPPRPQIQEGIFDSFRFGLSVMDMRLEGVDIEWLVETQIRRRFAPNLESVSRPTSSALTLKNPSKAPTGV